MVSMLILWISFGGFCLTLIWILNEDDLYLNPVSRAVKHFLIRCWEAVRYLLTLPLHRKPLEADAARIAELEHWNRTWSHPEIGNFYAWDPERGYEEVPERIREPLDRSSAAKRVSSDIFDDAVHRVWSVPKGMTLGSRCPGCGITISGVDACFSCTTSGTGMTLGSWCKRCQRPAHGAEYCRRCVNRTKTTCKDCCEDTGHTIDGRCATCHWDHRYGRKDRCKDTMCGGYGTIYRGGRCKGCYEVRMKERRCAWCGATGAQLWSDGGRWYCNRQCRLLYRTEP